MNKEIYQMCEKINESIKKSECYRNYVITKEKIESDIELIELKKSMERIKKENCIIKNDALVKQYYDLENKYESNIDVKRYRSYGKEIYSLLKEVSDILSIK